MSRELEAYMDFISDFREDTRQAKTSVEDSLWSGFVRLPTSQPAPIPVATHSLAEARFGSPVPVDIVIGLRGVWKVGGASGADDLDVGSGYIKLTWGVGRTSFSAEVDIRNGWRHTLVASEVKVEYVTTSVWYGAPVNIPASNQPRDLVIGAAITPSAQSGGNTKLTRTLYGLNQAALTSMDFYVPPWATQFRPCCYWVLAGARYHVEMLGNTLGQTLSRTFASTVLNDPSWVPPALWHEVPQMARIARLTSDHASYPLTQPRIVFELGL